MSRLILVSPAAILVLLCLWWSGCSPSSESGLDEEKEPNYLAGRSRKFAQDYTGAIEAFEQALEANRRSAAAHLELGLIYYQNVTSNWARAIYHFEKYLELRPKANNADLIRQNIDYCKLALAKEVPYTPNNDLIRKEVERMGRENTDLRQQVEQLKAQLSLRPASAANKAAAFNSVNASTLRPLGSVQASSKPALRPSQAGERRLEPPPADETPRPVAAAKTHVVKSGDTPYAIARIYGVKLASLLGANPGLDPRRLRPGQTVVIPLQ
ncbi:MAG: hypothetical protein DME22_17625 [Verrucomicrobia bacterium]|nr:MAG: hypothetical protein DME22_17625 [Verrucomicrobiota bacterium]